MPTQTKAQIAADPGIALAPGRVRTTPIADRAAKPEEAKRPQPARKAGARARRGLPCLAKAPFQRFPAKVKQGAIHELMPRPEGASIDEPQAVAPNWKPSFITGTLGCGPAQLHGCDLLTMHDDAGPAQTKPGPVQA